MVFTKIFFGLQLSILRNHAFSQSINVIETVSEFFKYHRTIFYWKNVKNTHVAIKLLGLHYRTAEKITDEKNSFPNINHLTFDESSAIMKVT